MQAERYFGCTATSWPCPCSEFCEDLCCLFLESGLIDVFSSVITLLRFFLQN